MDTSYGHRHNLPSDGRDRRHEHGLWRQDDADIFASPDSIVSLRGRAVHRRQANNILEGTYSPHHSPPGQISSATQIAQEYGLFNRPNTTRAYDGTTSRTGAPTRRGRTDWVGTDRSLELVARLSRPFTRAASPRPNRTLTDASSRYGDHKTSEDFLGMHASFAKCPPSSFRDTRQGSSFAPRSPPNAADFSQDTYLLPATTYQIPNPKTEDIPQKPSFLPTTVYQPPETRPLARSHTVPDCSARLIPEPLVIRRDTTRKMPRTLPRPGTPLAPVPHHCAHYEHTLGPMHVVAPRYPKAEVKSKVTGLRRFFSLSRK